MIHETMIDQAMNRLMDSFGATLVLHPPASCGDLARLEARVGPLPRDLILFLATCDGLRLRRQGDVADAGLAGTRAMQRELQSGAVPAAPACYVFLRAEADGATDWLALDEGPLHGAVLRWQPGTRGEQIIASSFGAYFDAWTRYLADRYGLKGKRKAGEKPRPFDARYVEPFDPGAKRLARSAEGRAYLREFEMHVSPGEDAE